MGINEVCNYYMNIQIVINIIIALSCLFTGISIIYSGRSDIKYEKTTATISGGEISLLSKNNKDEYLLILDYKYVINGKKYTYKSESKIMYENEISAKNALNKFISDKKTIDVYYDINNPGKATAMTQSFYTSRGISIIVCAIIFIIMIVVSYIYKENLCELFFS